MKSKFLYSSVFMFACIVAACVTVNATTPTITPAPIQITQVFTTPTPRSSPPTIVGHPWPNFGINEEALIAKIAKLGGCTEVESGFTCPPGSNLGSLGCEELSDEIKYPGLKPYPIFTCYRGRWDYNHELPDVPGFEAIGMTARGGYGEFTFDGKQFVLIKEKSDYQKLYAPIDSANEALSYAMAFPTYSWLDSEFRKYNFLDRGCGLSARQYGYSQKFENEVYYTDRIEETFVKETESGFFVHLFLVSPAHAGACQWRSYAVDVLVKPSGEMSIIEPGPQLLLAWDYCTMPDEDPCR
jgi:hypothetical protein